MGPGGELPGERLSRRSQASRRSNRSLDLDALRRAVMEGAGPLPERVGGGWLLRNVVTRLRRKLGDDAGPGYIFTEPRVG